MNKLETVKKYLVENNAVIFAKTVNINLLNQTDRLAYVMKNRSDNDKIKKIVRLHNLSFIEKQYYLAILGDAKIDFNIKQLQLLDDCNKTLFSLASLENEADSELVQNYLSGLLIYLARNYKINLASLVATNIYKKIGSIPLLNNYTEFLFLNMQEDGTIGVINPLNKNQFSESEYQKWQYANTIFSYVYLKQVV
ncbi:hypothetical protein [uncultured Lactobacillus sp.]|uniref:hypothetical protein n=1 Tax=uncultured Lactobacillus sp. TaxID=153152 RepID=UPI00262BD10A|nr:hypothetical protein [uncultured Lactobacillus sp.]